MKILIVSVREQNDSFFVQVMIVQVQVTTVHSMTDMRKTNNLRSSQKVMKKMNEITVSNRQTVVTGRYQ